MIVLQTVAVAFAMFSAVPVPQFNWTEKNMRYAMCAFPLIGVGIGLLPSSVPKYLRPDLCSVPIDGPQWNFSFLLISRRERSRASVRAMFELTEHL